MFKTSGKTADMLVQFIPAYITIYRAQGMF